MKCSWWEFSTTWQRLTPLLSHIKNYTLQLDQTRCILLSGMYSLWNWEKICYPCRVGGLVFDPLLPKLLPWATRPFVRFPASFLLNLIAQKVVTAGNNVFPHQTVFFLFFAVLSTVEPDRTGHFQRTKAQIMLSTPPAKLLQESLISKDEAPRSVKPTSPKLRPLFLLNILWATERWPMTWWLVTCPKKILVVQPATKTEQYGGNWPCLQLCFWPGLCTRVFMYVNELWKVAQPDPPYGDVPFQRIFIHCWKRITPGAWLGPTAYCFEGTRWDSMSVSPPHKIHPDRPHPPHHLSDLCWDVSVGFSYLNRWK